MKRGIDLPQLQSVVFDKDAFQYAKTFEVSALTSLQSIDFGDWCFSGYNDNNYDRGVSLFSLIGITE